MQKLSPLPTTSSVAAHHAPQNLDLSKVHESPSGSKIESIWGPPGEVLPPTKTDQRNRPGQSRVHKCPRQSHQLSMAKDDPRRALDRWKGYRNGEVFFFYSYTKKGFLGRVRLELATFQCTVGTVLTRKEPPVLLRSPWLMLL